MTDQVIGLLVLCLCAALGLLAWEVGKLRSLTLKNQRHIKELDNEMYDPDNEKCGGWEASDDDA